MTIINAVIQVRMGSQRFPGKTLKRIQSFSCLELLVKRIRKSKLLNKIIVATSELPKDKEIVSECKKLGLDYYIGEEQDVHGRLSLCLKDNPCEFFLRITGDDILLDQEIVDFFCKKLLKEKPDFISSFDSKSFPNGFVLSGFRTDFFLSTNEEYLSEFDREHVIPFYLKNKNNMKFLSIRAKKKWEGYGLNFAIDNSQDLDRLELLTDIDWLDSSSSYIISQVKKDKGLKKLFSANAEY